MRDLEPMLGKGQGLDYRHGDGRQMTGTKKAGTMPGLIWIWGGSDQEKANACYEKANGKEAGNGVDHLVCPRLRHALRSMRRVKRSSSVGCKRNEAPT